MFCSAFGKRTCERARGRSVVERLRHLDVWLIQRHLETSRRRVCQAAQATACFIGSRWAWQFRNLTCCPGVWVMRKKVGCGVGRARFGVPIPCPSCRTVIEGTGTVCSSNRCLSLSLFCALSLFGPLVQSEHVKKGFLCHCHLPTGPLEHFKKRLRTFSILALCPLAAVAQGGQPSRFRLSRWSPGRCCR